MGLFNRGPAPVESFNCGTLIQELNPNRNPHAQSGGYAEIYFKTEKEGQSIVSRIHAFRGESGEVEAYLYNSSNQRRYRLDPDKLSALSITTGGSCVLPQDLVIGRASNLDLGTVSLFARPGNSTFRYEGSESVEFVQLQQTLMHATSNHDFSVATRPCTTLLGGKEHFSLHLAGEGRCALKDLDPGTSSFKPHCAKEIYFKTESGNVYRLVSRGDTIQVNDKKGAWNLAVSRTESDKELEIGQSVRLGGGMTSTITEIEIVTDEMVGVGSGASKRKGPLSAQFRNEPHSERPIFHLANASREYERRGKSGPEPAVYFETAEQGKYLFFLAPGGWRAVDINECEKRGKFDSFSINPFMVTSLPPSNVPPTHAPMSTNLTLERGEPFAFKTNDIRRPMTVETAEVSVLRPLRGFRSNDSENPGDREIISAIHRLTRYQGFTDSGEEPTEVITLKPSDFR